VDAFPAFLHRSRRNGRRFDTSCFHAARALDLTAETGSSPEHARPHDAKRLLATSWNLEHNLNFFENPLALPRPKPLQLRGSTTRRWQPAESCLLRGWATQGCSPPSRHLTSWIYPQSSLTRTLHVAPPLLLRLEGSGDDQSVNWSPVKTGAESPRKHPPKQLLATRAACRRNARTSRWLTAPEVPFTFSIRLSGPQWLLLRGLLARTYSLEETSSGDGPELPCAFSPAAPAAPTSGERGLGRLRAEPGLDYARSALV
jgi:hypothetical protein